MVTRALVILRSRIDASIDQRTDHHCTAGGGRFKKDAKTAKAAAARAPSPSASELFYFMIRLGARRRHGQTKSPGVRRRLAVGDEKGGDEERMMEQRNKRAGRRARAQPPPPPRGGGGAARSTIWSPDKRGGGGGRRGCCVFFYVFFLEVSTRPPCALERPSLGKKEAGLWSSENADTRARRGGGWNGWIIEIDREEERKRTAAPGCVWELSSIGNGGGARQ